jgi:hypothetical protein
VGFISSLPQLAWDKRLSCCCCSCGSKQGTRIKDDEPQKQYQQVSNNAHRNSKFPLFCLLALVGIKFLFFCFFLIFLLNQGHKRGNSTKYQLKPMKDMIDTILGAFGKTGAGTS